MTIAAGTQLGPYQVVALLGAGGMGQVWRARDPRLGRDVAIKVLPATLSKDPDRLRRFEQEARAAGILNHPNLTAVFDIGEHAGAPYVVEELLEGETLRQELAGGPLATRRAIEQAAQLALGLAAAHEKGIVHRDLKPENVFVTRDGRVKILDFGLAKLTQAEEATSGTNLPTATPGTEPGVVLGTLGYMSPEQVRGRPADARSDIFSFGAILYEMLAGQRAFRGDSAADTISAILKEDPPDLSATNRNISPGLERIVRHCVEKNPERRFQSAHDLAFDLETLSGISGAPIPAATPRRVHRASIVAGVAAAAALALLAGGYWVGRRSASGARTAPAEHVSRKRLTFRRGNVLFARFTADAQDVVYGAAWGDRPTEVFLTHVGSPESRPLGLPGASLLSVSPSGELAVLLKKNNLFGATGSGTLARVPLAGGAPRQIAEDITAADWTPDGRNLVALRDVGGKSVLEFPLGHPVFSTASALSGARVSPDGKRVAVIESDGTSFWIDLFDAGGTRKELARDFLYVDTLAWPASGREIWFDGVDRQLASGIFAVSLEGAERTVDLTTDLEVLHDIARDGSVLVEREISTREILGEFSGDRQERNLSWLEQSNVAALSADGKTMLFWESGEGGGGTGSVYLRTSDGTAPVRLGEGRACDLSPDGKWALAIQQSSAGPRLVLLPTGAGEPKPVPVPGLQILFAGFHSPEGKQLVVVGSEPGHGVRAYLAPLSGGPPRAVTGELSNGGASSPDGRFLAETRADRRAEITSVADGTSRLVPGLAPDDVPIQWSADGEDLYVIHYGEAPLPIYRLHLKSGKKEVWKNLMPADRMGFVRIENVIVTPDGASYAYSYNRVTSSDLFLVKGWR